METVGGAWIAIPVGGLLCVAGRGIEVVVRQHQRAVDRAMDWLNPSISVQEVVSGKHPSNTRAIPHSGQMA
jgi:hypothetical protein